jgi:transposase
MRRDLVPVRTGDELATQLRMLASRRTDLVCDRTRAFNRLRATLLEYFPALEAALDLAGRKSAVQLLTRYHTPGSIRRAGVSRITAWLRAQGCRSPQGIAEAAVAAAGRQHVVVPGQDAGAMIVASLAADILRLHAAIDDLDAQIEIRFRRHEHAGLLLSLPGFGPLLAAEFIAATGGTMAHYDSADRLAAIAGVAPVPKDSGRVSGNHHCPKRYDRRLLRACFLAAQTAARCCPESRAFYDRKRGEGKNHNQAVLALARRRINVIWAMLRDRQTFQPRPPSLAPSTA